MELSYGFSLPPANRLSASYVARIAAAFRHAAGEFSGYGDSMWAGFSDRQSSVLAAVRANDLERLHEMLSDPSEHEFFWGFDDLVSSFTVARLNTLAGMAGSVKQLYYDALVQLAVTIGALAAPNPEAGQEMPSPGVEEMLLAIDDVFGFKVDFPNPFRRMFGLTTSRGVADIRSIHALYQSWRVSQVATYLGGTKILEIGAGLGRNAYYVRKFGIDDYTIVDIPTTQVAQGAYLGLVAGESSVSLAGSDTASEPLRLRSPKWLHETEEHFDVVVNADSLTEMDPANAFDYVTYAKAHSDAFLSFNHESNPASVKTLLRRAGMLPLSRSLYPLRGGYIEELVLIARPAKPAIGPMRAPHGDLGVNAGGRSERAINQGSIAAHASGH